MLYHVNSPYYRQFISSTYTRKVKQQGIKDEKAI
jgi:hypothetical protein